MLATFLAPAILGLSLVGAQAVSAHGFMGWRNASPEEIVSRQQTMFQDQANLLGISVDEVKQAWAEGKSLKELAEEKGLTAEQLQVKMKDLHRQAMKTQLQTLVDKGVITQSQADSRLKIMENQGAERKGHMGMGFGFGLGF